MNPTKEPSRKAGRNDQWLRALRYDPHNRDYWIELLAGNPSIDDLIYLLEYVPDRAKEAGELLLKREDLCNETLLLIAQHAPTERFRAWHAFITQDPSTTDLCKAIRWIEELRPAAWRILRGKGPSAGDLAYLQKWVPELASVSASTPLS